METSNTKTSSATWPTGKKMGSGWDQDPRLLGLTKTDSTLVADSGLMPVSSVDELTAEHIQKVWWVGI